MTTYHRQEPEDGDCPDSWGLFGAPVYHFDPTPGTVVGRQILAFLSLVSLLFPPSWHLFRGAHVRFLQAYSGTTRGSAMEGSWPKGFEPLADSFGEH